MTALDKYFKGNRPAELDPMARSWTRLLEKGGAKSAQCEVWRRKEVLGFSPTKLHVTFFGEGDAVLREDNVEWDVELNDVLLRLRVRAVSIENEGVRFALVLRDRLKRAEFRFGDGFYNAVLVEYVKGSPFAEQSALAHVLEVIKEYEPYKGGAAHGDCIEAIETSLIDAGHALGPDGLGYSEEEGGQILSKALAMYLDERFSVSDRAAFGWS